MKYQAIIFDFDGVLFDSEAIHRQACNHVLVDFGFTLPEEDYLAHYIGLSDAEMFPLIFERKSISIKQADIKKIQLAKIAAYKQIIESNETLTGVRGVKSFIESHVNQFQKLGICTGATREELTATLTKLEQGKLQAYFQTMVTADDVTAGKPSPEGFLLTAQRLAISPAECLVIEDTLKGIQAAKTAGMTVVGITTSYNKQVLSSADLVVDDYKELEYWLS